MKTHYRIVKLRNGQYEVQGQDGFMRLEPLFDSIRCAEKAIKRMRKLAMDYEPIEIVKEL